MKGRALGLLVAAGVVVGLAPVGGRAPALAPAQGPAPGAAVLIFQDEFDGPALDAQVWDACSAAPTSRCANNHLAEYREGNVSVANGVLTLQARQEDDGAYASGGISSGGFAFAYGYVEARIKVPAGQGLWPAFWTLPADGSWPPEIDIVEILGHRPNVAELHYHYRGGGAPSGLDRASGKAWTGPDFSAGWHTFGVDWQPGSLVWYVDGVERWRFTGAAVTAAPQRLLLNLAVGGRWPGPPNASTPFPRDFLVDYVRVWDQLSKNLPLTGI